MQINVCYCFWLRGRFRVIVLHVYIKFCTDIFIQYGNNSIL